MKQHFGSLSDGRQVDLYWIEDEYTHAAITNLGAAIVRWLVPDATGKKEDIVLGYDSAQEYFQNPGMMGAIVGRNANRIKDAQYSLNGSSYPLTPTSGPHNIHSGPNGYNLRLWEVVNHSKSSISFQMFSPDGDQGFPGNAQIVVTYALTGDALEIAYEMVCDQDTVFNVTSHAYFNLGGHQNTEQAMDHTLWLNALQYTPTDEAGIPTGKISDVSGTYLDFTMCRSLNTPPVPSRGYDHNFVLAGNPAAVLRHPASGRKLTVITDRPGLQLYSGNHLNLPGKDGIFYSPRSGICLETQFYPDSIHHPHWPQPIAKANCTYYSITAYCYR